MIKAASLSTDTNLLSFSQLLNSHGLPHRINEESGQQVIWVRTAQEAEYVRDVLIQWQAEIENNTDAPDFSQPPYSNSKWRSQFKFLLNKLVTVAYYYPVTSLLFGVCLVVAVNSSLGAQANNVAFLFYPSLATDGLLNLLSGIKTPLVFLQTLSPMFLHFGELHLVFNMLWLWYFGRQLETIQSVWVYSFLILVTAFVSNTTQYMVSDANNFGGMSGVVYGLVGYTWTIHKLMPKSYLSLNGNMFAFFLIALIAMEILASSLIATAAHVGGLLGGLVSGLLVVVVYRLVLRRNVVGRKPPATLT